MEGKLDYNSSTGSTQTQTEPIQKKMVIRTMAKDIARLRGEVLEAEREKIVKMKPEEETKAALKAAEKEKKKMEEERKRLEAERKKAEEEARKKAEEERRRREKELFLAQRRDEEEKKKAEEQRKRAELEARKRAEEERLKKEKELLLAKKRGEEEVKRKMAEEGQRAELEKLQKETALKAAEEEKKKKEYEMTLLKKREEEEAKKRAEEEKIKLEAERRKAEEERKRMAEAARAAKLKEFLGKFKAPIEKVKTITELRKEKEIKPEEKPKLEERFFIKMPTEKVAEIEKPAETGKTPEELLLEKLKVIEERREKEKQERDEFLKRVEEGKIEVKPVAPKEEVISRYPLMAKLPQKKSPLFEKVFVRIIVVGFLVASWAAIITFWYWFLVGRKPVIVTPTPITPPVETQQIIIPPSLIPVLKTHEIEYLTSENLRLSIFQLLNEVYPKGQFQRIVIKDKDSVLTLQEFFDALSIETPLAIYQKLEPNFTLFLYPTEKYNRLGFLVKIQDRENLANILKAWEPTMEKDFENLFILLDKQKPALIPYFRGAQYRATTFRFQTFALNDLGICYGLFSDYLVWSSSWDSMTKAIDLLK